MYDLLLHLSSDYDKALPAFITSVYDKEHKELLELIEDDWKQGKWTLMLTHVDRFLQYSLGENTVPSPELINSLIPITKRLWFLSTFDVILNDNNRQLKQLYSDEICILEHILSFKGGVTLKKKSRSLKMLNSILGPFLEIIPPIWESNGESVSGQMSEKLNFINVNVLFVIFNSYYNRSYKSTIFTSASRRRSWMSSIVRLSTYMRRFWLYREDIGDCVVDELLSDIDVNSSEIFYKFRLLLLLCPNVTIFKHLLNGDLFKWWSLVNGEMVSSWNSLMVSLLYRGVKFGWATGTPLYNLLSSRIPHFFNILYSSFSIPNRVSVVKYKETIPGEYSILLGKGLKFYSKFGKTLALLLPPKKDTEEDAIVFDYITALINTIYPYTHPSSSGKWSNNIAGFTRSFVCAYTRRLCCESTGNGIVRKECGNIIQGDISNSAGVNSLRSFKLTALNNTFVIDHFYALALQGMHSKHMPLSYAYEDVIKRLCHIQPLPLLNNIIEQMLSACDCVTEPHQALSALRLFSQLAPLIVQYTPESLLPILDNTLKAINASDPFKTVQSLTLINVIFSIIPCLDLSNVELPRDLKERYIKSYYISGEDNNFNVKRFLFKLPRVTVKDASGVTGEISDDSHISLMLSLESTKTVDEGLELLDKIISQRQCVSQYFPLWCQDLFDVILQLATQLTKPNMTTNSLMNTIDVSLFILLRSALVTTLSQADVLALTEICNTFTKWVLNNASKKESLNYMTAIAACLSYCNPKLVLDTVFKDLLTKFKREVELSKSDLYNHQVEEDRLMWFTLCFSCLVRYSSKHIISYFDDIIYIVNVGISYKSKGAFKAAAKLLQRCIYTLINVYFTDSKCVCPRENNAEMLLWDVPWFIRELGSDLAKERLCNINWHIPTDVEVEAAFKFMNYCVNCVLILSNDVLSDLSIPSFTTKLDVKFDQSLTVFGRINRVYILCKYILKGLKHLIVDERDFNVKGMPRITPFEDSRLIEAQAFVRSVILSIMNKYGNEVDSMDDLLVTNVLLKLLKLVDLYLLRGVCCKDAGSLDLKSVVYALRQSSSIGTTITANKGMFPWLSFYHGIDHKSFWQDVPRVAWLTMVYDCFLDRLNLRKFGHQCINHRRDMLNLILECATCHYKQVSARARNILKGCTVVHGRIKIDVIEYILNRGFKLIEDDNNNNSECLATIPECIDASLINSIIVKDWLFSKYLKMVFGVVSTVENKDSLMNKYDSFFSLFLNAREVCSCTDKYCETLSEILNLLEISSKHWRFQLYCTATLVAFRNHIKRDGIIKYVTWLVDASDAKTKQSCIITVALFGLLQFLVEGTVPLSGRSACVLSCNYLTEVFNDYLRIKVAKLSLNDNVSSVSDRDVLENKKVPARQDENVAELLSQELVIKRLLNALAVVNHDSVKQSSSSSQTINSIVSSVIKLDKTWPTNRIAPNSTSLSLHNLLFAFHYLFYLLKMEGFVEHCINHISYRTIKLPSIIHVLEELNDTSPTNCPENHLAFIEICGGLMWCSIELPEYREEIWYLLYPILKKELDVITQDRILDLMDAIRLVLNDYKRENDHLYLPIFNLAMNYNKGINLIEPITSLSFDCVDCNVPGYNLQVVKQLKLYQAVLQQLLCNNTVLIERLLSVLLNNEAMFNNSQQIRDEIGYLCSLVVYLCCNGNAGSEIYKDNVHEFVSKTIDDVTDQDDYRVKGLLSVVGLLFSLSMPMVDLNHKYISQYFEFALKLSRHANTNINELATKAIHNIAMAYYYIGDFRDSVECLTNTIYKNSRNSHYKIKINLIHVSEMLQRNMCMYIRKTNVEEILLNMYITFLKDSQVRDVARNALSAIAISTNDDTYVNLTNKFFQLVNLNDIDSMFAGVIGLASLVSTAPYHVPNWLPNTLTTLVSLHMEIFGAPNVVQRSLQEFFKSHTDAWSQIHVNKFTRHQLELLDMYKGCPVYFN